MAAGRLRGAGLVLGLVAMGLGLVGVGLVGNWKRGDRGQAAGNGSPAHRAGVGAPTAGESSEGVLEGLRRGDAQALRAAESRFGESGTEVAASTPKALGDGEAEALVALAEALRDGYGRFQPVERKAVLDLSVKTLGRFGAEGEVAGWRKLLKPCGDVLTAAAADPQPPLRAGAMEGLGKIWSWSPGRTMTKAEEDSLGDWKEQLYPLTRKCLRDSEPGVRIAAAQCLAALPIDQRAMPAMDLLEDPDPRVRFQVLTAFSGRPGVLTEEAILPLLHDPLPDMSSIAEKILRVRGLSNDLIGLARMITHQRPALRASAIPMLTDRQDIDPIVWLLKLTEDPDAEVRLKAVEAFSGRVTPEVRQRLLEMAQGDESLEVREAAAKLAPPETPRTAALPPLPGSRNLAPRAN